MKKKRLLISILIGVIVVVSFASLILFNKFNSIKSIEGYTINYYPYEIIAEKNDILVKKNTTYVKCEVPPCPVYLGKSYKVNYTKEYISLFKEI